MTNLTITASDVSPVEILQQFTGPAMVAISAGQWVYEGANGKISKATTTAYGERHGMALNTAVANDAVTVCEDGTVDIGNALTSADIGTAVKISTDAGRIEDSAGSGQKIGVVTGSYGATTVDKLLKIMKEAS